MTVMPQPFPRIFMLYTALSTPTLKTFTTLCSCFPSFLRSYNALSFLLLYSYFGWTFQQQAHLFQVSNASSFADFSPFDTISTIHDIHDHFTLIFTIIWCPRGARWRNVSKFCHLISDSQFKSQLNLLCSLPLLKSNPWPPTCNEYTDTLPTYILFFICFSIIAFQNETRVIDSTIQPWRVACETYVISKKSNNSTSPALPSPDLHDLINLSLLSPDALDL